jgi:hypothetical protein
MLLKFQGGWHEYFFQQISDWYHLYPGGLFDFTVLESSNYCRMDYRHFPDCVRHPGSDG